MFSTRKTAALLAAALLSLGTATTTAHAGTPVPRLSLPVGTWDTYIDFGGGAIVHVVEAYTVKGELCHTGGTNGYGKGTWRPTGRNTFTYEVVEKFTDDQGRYAGRAEMGGSAVQTGDVFRTDHTSTVYDAEGNFLFSDRGEIVFTRSSKANPKCPANNR
ncbi:hypothetical protein [Streptomyces sp. NPDC056049]|uniref:hypothetical protein n=1 Tax=Streptomyces sp. NPDC056049 TaxID=3345693 RepID=UPI0035DF6111